MIGNTNSQSKAKHNYSTDEQVVGTWIDGKPLYEKTLHFTKTGKISAGFDVSDIILEIYNLKSVDGYFIYTFATDNIIATVPYGRYFAVYTNTTNNTYTATVYSDFTSNTADFEFFITIQYTKTTD